LYGIILCLFIAGLRLQFGWEEYGEILLVYDGAPQHLVPDLMEIFVGFGIVVLVLPAHSSNWSQGFDVVQAHPTQLEADKQRASIMRSAFFHYLGNNLTAQARYLVVRSYLNGW
jgi:hypothetical protein